MYPTSGTYKLQELSYEQCFAWKGLLPALPVTIADSVKHFSVLLVLVILSPRLLLLLVCGCVDRYVGECGCCSGFCFGVCVIGVVCFYGLHDVRLDLLDMDDNNFHPC